MKAVKHLTVRKANKLEKFSDSVRFPLGITYPDGSVPTPGTWLATVAKQWEKIFGPSLDDDARRKEHL